MGAGSAGGNGGDVTGGNGSSGAANGGGITVDVSGTLVLEPHLATQMGSKEPDVVVVSAFDFITSNSAIAGRAGGAGLAGSATPGTGGPEDPVGAPGMITPGHAGVIGVLKQSEGGGIAIFGTATAIDTVVTNNHASASPNILGKLST